MKKVLISSFDMEIGGVERSLISMLDNFDYENYDVDLMLYSHSGDLMKLLPKKPNLLAEAKKYKTFRLSIGETIKRGNLAIGIARLAARYNAKKTANKNNSNDSGYIQMQYMWKYSLLLLPKIEKEYDIAISYLWPHYFVADKVKAKTKIAWIHTDYTKLVPNKKLDMDTYSKIDYIVTVSKDCENQFLSVYPMLKDKSLVVENILSEKFIKEQASEKIIDDKFDINKDQIKLVSIGRFTDAKNFDNVPQICKYILEKGINVKWYIIGFGGDETLIKQKIKEFGMEGHVIILGKKENPYPYIKACDIYVQPSRYEGKAVTVREAQILNKPVVITNFATANSQLIDGFDGIIVPMDNERCAKGIVKLIKDKELQSKLIENTKKTDYSNKEEIKKIYNILGE